MPRRKGYEECRKVPTVDCFLVLKTVPDLECSPEAYEDCIDVAKEVRIEYSRMITLSRFASRFLISKKKRNASKFLSRCAPLWRKR